MFKLAHNESIDLGYSAFIIINKKILSTDRKEFGLHDNQVLDAVEQLENEMTVSRYKQLKSLVNKYIFHTYVVRISCEHPDWTEVEVVAYIRQLSEQEFYEDYLNKQIGEDHNFEDDEIKERIEICTNNNANKESDV